MDIAEIDKNFKLQSTLDEKDIVWYNSHDSAFDIYGLYNPHDNVYYRRMPSEIAKSVSDGVAHLSCQTAGGRIRFSTDSNYIAIKYVGSCLAMAHMPSTGNTGFDLYIDGDNGSEYYRTFVPPTSFDKEYDRIIYLPVGKKYVTINFPLYNGVRELYIGVREGSFVGEGKKYKYDKPVVYYGSSITQGGCASRPGNAYQAILSRMLDCDFINLGFSGSGKGEKNMCDYIASLDMSAFFMDYDHNAPNVDHLRATHEALYLTVREKHPDIPIIMASKSDDVKYDSFIPARRSVIYETYRKALERGENVYFIDGQQIFGVEFRDCCTVDGCHPNDYGFVQMAKYFYPYLKRALEKQR
ncbi:MAG: hypothetical protein E7588_07605 [Ruminococcaceae bacterium]|nr:hypothetical protein [Oscillospiraceae bacterium]